jgi:RNA polymerase sigma-70 factor (ECF subfamily)
MAKANLHLVAPDCWARLKQGDPSALGELYDQYVDKLFLAAASVTTDRELVKDALQEVFIEIWHYRETIGDVQYPQAYLTRVMRNILIKRLKKEEKFSCTPLEEAIPDYEDNREEALISADTDREMNSRLGYALNNLTNRQRLILRLHFYEGLSYEQIARKLSMNYQSVNNLAFRTIRHLRDLMLILIVISAENFFHFF